MSFNLYMKIAFAIPIVIVILLTILISVNIDKFPVCSICGKSIIFEDGRKTIEAWRHTKCL